MSSTTVTAIVVAKVKKAAKLAVRNDPSLTHSAALEVAARRLLSGGRLRLLDFRWGTPVAAAN